MIDRTKPPKFKLTTDISLPKVNKIRIDNDVPLVYINDNREDVIQLFINFKSGSWVQKKRLVADTTLRMIREGTKDKDSQQIAETINFYGAELKFHSGYHTNTITLTVLNQHLEPMLELLNQMLTQPTFPQQELEILMKTRKQNYLIELENVDVVARNLFYEAVFGYEHPYGTYAKPEDFDQVTRQDLIDYFNNFFILQNMYITVGGNVNYNVINLINKYLTQLPDTKPPKIPEYSVNPAKNKDIHKPKGSALQSAIIIGDKTINIFHPDYNDLRFVVMILGGYFGSRLMSNIREQKGLTYGIWAGIDNMLHSGVLFIEASVRKEELKQVLDQIHKEIQKLKTQPVTDQELLTVKNYFLSQMLNLINGTFAFTKYINTLRSFNLDENIIYKTINDTKKINKQRVEEIAAKYLCFEDFYKVTVG